MNCHARQNHPATRFHLSGPGLRSFNAIISTWGLDRSVQQLILGSPSITTFRVWRQAARNHQHVNLSTDALKRIDAVLRIQDALWALFPNDAGYNWLHSANKAEMFRGQAPINLLRAGTLDGITTVRKFLEAVRDGMQR